MNKGHDDPGFDSFRKQRERRRLVEEKPSTKVSQDGALKELMEVEAREELNRVLTRDVQDFFESATRVAATIVGRVANSEKSEVESKLNMEMEEFLKDALSRLEQVVMQFVERSQGPEAKQEVEPHMHNLVGQMLDGFRAAGTAGVSKHLGVDPMTMDLESVQREFRSKLPSLKLDLAAIVPVSNLEAVGKQGVAGKPATSDMEEHHVAHISVAHERKAAPVKSRAALAGAKRSASPKLTPELELYKAELKQQVRTGAMHREEARIAWQKRVGG
ncbi:hypothetical protein LBMAG49_11900 [Planctomycetota bacterium]|nr:hypothetical protein LBMAG49_11900 [Planctomycetota bacterium]